MTAHLRTALIFGVATASCFTLIPSVTAQMKAQAFQIHLGGGPAARSRERTPEGMQSVMRLRIDTMRRIAGLSEDAIKKLDVATMAAVKLAFDNTEKQHLRVQRGRNNKLELDNNALSDEDAEAKRDNNEKFKEIEFQELTLDAVLEQPIWQKTVQNTLTEEQQAKMKAYWADRKAFSRQAAIQSKVSQLDQYLNLSPDQREAMAKVVDEVLGDELEKRPGIVQGGGVIRLIVNGQQKDTLKEEHVRPVLSEAQIAEFKRRPDGNAHGAPGAVAGLVMKQLGAKPADTKWTLGIEIEETPKGMVAKSVAKDSSAQRAGVQAGDVIDSIEGEPADSLVQLKRLLEKNDEKGELELKVIRNGTPRTFHVSQPEE